MSNSCSELNIKPIKVNELGIYTSLQSNDLLLTVQKYGSNFYSRKTTWGDFLNSILHLTSSLSGNINGQLSGNFNGTLFGNLTGSIFGNNLKGTFIGKSSITGIPFDTLNDKSISFKGTGSYSISSSYSPISIYSTNTISSSYSLSSNYISCSIADNSLNSRYSKSSSLSILSITSSYSYYSDRTITSSKTDYTLSGVRSDKTNYSYKSKESFSSSYNFSSSYFGYGDHSKRNITSSYTLFSKDTNITKAFSQFWGYDASQFRDFYDNISLNPQASYNIKSIKYAGRKRLWSSSEGSTNDKWWPTFYIEFLEPLKNTNYLVQGTIWEIDLFGGGEPIGNDGEIGTFQIPEIYQSNKSITAFTMSWQGGLKCDGQIWMASFHVIGTDISNINYNNVSAISGAINFV